MLTHHEQEYKIKGVHNVGIFVSSEEQHFVLSEGKLMYTMNSCTCNCYAWHKKDVCGLVLFFSSFGD